MASRRILSNSDLAPIQDIAVNPYNSFNSDSINKLTRIVSGGNGNDVIVDGLDTLSNDIVKWYASNKNILPEFTNKTTFDAKWSHNDSNGESCVYILEKDNNDQQNNVTGCYIDFVLPHQSSLGYSKIWTKLDDSKFIEYYGHDKEKDFEVSFDLEMGTPQSIVIYLNSTKVVIDHPSSKRQTHYTIYLNRNFIRDTKENGLWFTFGAVLDAADPKCTFETEEDTNKTYIRVSNIQLKVLGYNRKQWPVALGPINGVYGLSSIHPLHSLFVTPGLAIKDDAMLEELAIKEYDKDKVVELDIKDSSSWINGVSYTTDDFNNTSNQYAYQLNNTNGYIRRICSFDDGHVKINVGNLKFDPTDDLELTDQDQEISFKSYEEDTDGNIILHFVNNGSVKITTGGNTALIVYNVNGEKKVLDKVIFDVDNNGVVGNFDVTIDGGKLYGKVNNPLTVFKAYASYGPFKVSGDPQLYNCDSVRWAYIVVYYSYFKNPKPNVSYIGLVREEDLNHIKYREDYLILAKVRFIDPWTIDIVSYENRQRKLLPRSDKINYSSTCNYPEIWYEDVPDSVTDAINYLAKFDVNLAKLIKYKHDYNAEISTAFNLAKTTSNNSEKAPFISINPLNHLERRIRVNRNKLIVDSVYKSISAFPNVSTIFNKQTITVNRQNRTIYVAGSDRKWALTFDQDIIDNTNINLDPQVIGNEVKVTATFGPYDSVNNVITNRYICFNSIGPFKFIDTENGEPSIKFDWIYEDDILLYPTSPSLVKENDKYVDIDNGGYSDGFYASKTGEYESTYMLSYTSIDGAENDSMNSDKNHFHYIKFRGDVLESDHLLHILDILPRFPEWLVEKRVLIGKKNDAYDNDQPHIQSSIHQLDDDMIDNHLLISQRDAVSNSADGIRTNHIKSSKFVIDDDLQNNNVLTSEDTTHNGIDESTIKSTNVILEPTGQNRILVSNECGTHNGITNYKITSSDYTVGDVFGYWFKPLISYYPDPSNSAARVIMDCDKNYIVRVSEILKYFDRSDPKVKTLTIKQIEKLNNNKTKYSYTTTANKHPELDQFVFTTQSDTDTVLRNVNNTIKSDTEQFARIDTSPSEVTIVKKGIDSYCPYDNQYDSHDDFYINIFPNEESSFYAEIETFNISGLTATIKIKNINIDNFDVKPGMKVYTKGITGDQDISRYNYLTVNTYNTTTKIITVTLDNDCINRLTSVTPQSIANAKIYFINTSSSFGLYPRCRIIGNTNGLTLEGLDFIDCQIGTTKIIFNGIEKVIEDINSDTNIVTLEGVTDYSSYTVSTTTTNSYVTFSSDTVFTNSYKNVILSTECKLDRLRFDIVKFQIVNNIANVYIISNTDLTNIKNDSNKPYLYLSSTINNDIIINKNDAVQITAITNTSITEIKSGTSALNNFTIKDNQKVYKITFNLSHEDLIFAQDVSNATNEDDFIYVSLFYRYKVDSVEIDSNRNRVKYRLTNSTINSILGNDCTVYTNEVESIIYDNSIPENISLKIEEVVTDGNNGYFIVTKHNSFDYNYSSNTFIGNAKFIQLSDIINGDAESKQLCNIRIDIDITNLQIDPEVLSKDDYDIIDRYFTGRILIVNDIDNNIDEDDQVFKKFVKLSFAILKNDEEIDDTVEGIDNPTKIIWKDEYRGYNKSLNKSLSSSYHDLYPVSVYSKKGVKGNYAEITTEYSIGSDGSLSGKAGFGLSRGPIYDLYCGIQGEFTFQYVRTIPETPNLDTINSNDSQTSILPKTINDLIYAQSHMYYIDNTQSSIEDNRLKINYISGPVLFKTGSNKITKIVSNPNSTTKYSDIPGNNDFISNDVWKISSTTLKWYYNNVINNNNEITSNTTLKSFNTHNIVADYPSKVIKINFISQNVNKSSRYLKIVSKIATSSESYQTIKNPLSKATESESSTAYITEFPSITRNGYVLDYWYYKDSSNNQICLISHNYDNFKSFIKTGSVDGEINIEAHWVETSLSVKFIKDTNTEIATYSYNDSTSDWYGKYNKLPNVSSHPNLLKLGYEFIGWGFIDSNNVTIQIYGGDILKSSQNHNLYAIYKPNIMVVEFDPHIQFKYTSNIPSPRLVKYGSNYNTSISSSEYDGRFGSVSNFNLNGNLPILNDFTDIDGVDYEFEGWSLNSNINTTKVENTTTVSKYYSHNLYAIWNIMNPVKLTVTAYTFPSGLTTDIYILTNESESSKQLSDGDTEIFDALYSGCEVTITNSINMKISGDYTYNGTNFNFRMPNKDVNLVIFVGDSITTKLQMKTTSNNYVFGGSIDQISELPTNGNIYNLNISEFMIGHYGSAPVHTLNGSIACKFSDDPDNIYFIKNDGTLTLTDPKYSASSLTAYMADNLSNFGSSLPTIYENSVVSYRSSSAYNKDGPNGSDKVWNYDVYGPDGTNEWEMVELSFNYNGSNVIVPKYDYIYGAWKRLNEMITNIQFNTAGHTGTVQLGLCSHDANSECNGVGLIVKMSIGQV